MCASKARQQYTPMGLFFSFTPIKMKLYTMKVPMKSKKKMVLQVSLKMNFNMQMSYTLIEYRLPKMYPHRLNFVLYSYHKQTSHSESIHEKELFCFTSFLEKSILNMQMSSTLGQIDLSNKP